jgi:hypothetical protein
VPENETTLYRGQHYEIGHGPGFYGIWPAGAPRPPSIEWWPDTPEGWNGAWTRFTRLEGPGATPVTPAPGVPMAPAGLGAPVPAGQPPAAAAAVRGPRAVAAASLLAAGVVCGIAGLFPGYLSGVSLAQQPANLVPHVLYLAAWASSALLILLGGARLRAGALLGLGTSVVTFGFFLADAGQVIAGGAHLMGAGLALGLAGWLVCTAGAAVAFSLRPSGARPRPAGRVRAAVLLREAGLISPDWRDRRTAVAVALAGAVALGTAITFAPSWDSYTLRTPAGVVHTLTAGNAFANPAAVIAGNVAVMVALVLAAVVAALWRPVRLGAALLVGAAIPMVAQVISALIQVGEAVSPAQFGISPAQAAQAGLTISTGLTPVFWVYVGFVVLLAVTCGWLLLAAPWPERRARPYPLPGSTLPGSRAVPAHPEVSYGPRQAM